jgi:hypothetical protein
MTTARFARARSFTLDGHTFYVLDLGPEGTWLWDQVTGQWCTFETDGYGKWSFANGTMWGSHIYYLVMTKARLGPPWIRFRYWR